MDFTIRALIVMVAAACAPSLPPAPLLPEQDPAFQVVKVAEPAGMAEAAANPFRLLPGDAVDLKTISKTPLDAPNLMVDEGGGVHVPLVGRVAVSGLTLRDAEIAIEKELSQYDKFAKVGLTVRDAGGHKATVVGAVTRPAHVPVKPGLRLVDLLAAGGGLKTAAVEGEELSLADLEAARLIRNNAALPVSVRRALEGDARHNVHIQAGDVLFVPPTRVRRVSVLGKVKAAKTLPFRRGMRLTEAIASAGGADKGADNADVRIIRGPLSNPKVYLANLKALTNGEGRDVVLAPGDVVFVTTHWFSSFAEVISELTPLIAAGTVAAILAR
jgi:polysaccharide export outer membrane protein